MRLIVSAAGPLARDMLPVASDVDVMRVMVPAPAEPTSSRPLRVLVAEDDPEMNLVLTEALAGDGHDVVCANSGTEALAALLGAARPDAAVMDVRMPGLSGLQVLAALRGSGSALPVIIITAFGDDAVHREAESLRASHVFDKPFDVDELRAVLVGIAGALP